MICIALDNPKYESNVGGVFRAAMCYNADLLVVSGKRTKGLTRLATDTPKAARHIPLLCVADVFDVLPVDCIPVAVELIRDATPLPEYQHPRSAFYVFGGEDRTLDESVQGRCRDVVYVPTDYCMNLAATVNVVLYDRLAKQMQRKLAEAA